MVIIENKVQPNIAVTNNFLLKWVISLMTARMKKLIYLSSLTAAVNNTQELDAEIIDKLNRLLHLAKTGNSSLQLPIFFSKAIWSNKSLLDPLFAKIRSMAQEGNKEQCEDCCLDTLINLTPKWMWYDTFERMRSDLSLLFSPSNCLIKHNN